MKNIESIENIENIENKKNNKKENISLLTILNPFSIAKKIANNLIKIDEDKKENDNDKIKLMLKKIRRIYLFIFLLTTIIASIIIATYYTKIFIKNLSSELYKEDISFKNNMIHFNTKDKEENYTLKKDQDIIFAINLKYNQTLYDPNQLNVSEKLKGQIAEVKKLYNDPRSSRYIIFFKDVVLVSNTKVHYSELFNIRSSQMSKEEIIKRVQNSFIAILSVVSILFLISLLIIFFIINFILKLFARAIISILNIVFKFKNIIIFKMNAQKTNKESFEKNDFKYTGALSNMSKAIINSALAFTYFIILIVILLRITLNKLDYILNPPDAFILIFCIYVIVAKIAIEYYILKNKTNKTKGENCE